MRKLESTAKTQAKSKYTHALITQHYDCQFEAVPVTYEMKESTKAVLPHSFLTEYCTPGGLAAHLFGRHLIYPGSVQLLKYILSPHLEEGRTNGVIKDGGKRAKIRTQDGNEIDTMFIDRREK